MNWTDYITAVLSALISVVWWNHKKEMKDLKNDISERPTRVEHDLAMKSHIESDNQQFGHVKELLELIREDIQELKNKGKK